MNHQNETNFEVNLLPVISLLAVCISFLLVTAAWIPLGSFNIKQAIGESTEQKEEPSSRIDISINAQNDYVISVERKGQKVKSTTLKNGLKNMREFEGILLRIKESYSEAKTAFVSPDRDTEYGSVIKVLEVLKKLDFKEVGMIPSL
ncbi:MAG: biopolymer transporter ExbD [Bdellovibrionales bacterium]|nr:biopolymer transporter ExbD [Bdellovibrionales bacterium]